jgi:4,5-DOPA dioxygenase extradiol
MKGRLLMQKMPVLFVGHGSPMNAIEVNPFTSTWKTVFEGIPKPKAILSVSAHWYVPGTRVSDASQLKTIYDMYGFPPELYAVSHPAPGAPELALEVGRMLKVPVSVDNTWGLDHGTWSVLHVVDPEAKIPVFQLSVDKSAEPADHYALGRQLAVLREQGVLIFGSGNVVHNLRQVDFGMDGGFNWAESFDRTIRDWVVARNDAEVTNFSSLGGMARMAVPTPDHFLPLLYVLGAADASDKVSVFNDTCTMGSLSMTGFLFKA